MQHIGRTGFEPAISRSTIGGGRPIEVAEHGSGHFVDLDLGGSGKVHLDGVGNEEPPGIELERFQERATKDGQSGWMTGFEPAISRSTIWRLNR